MGDFYKKEKVPWRRKIPAAYTMRSHTPHPPFPFRVHLADLRATHRHAAFPSRRPQVGVRPFKPSILKNDITSGIFFSFFARRGSCEWQQNKISLVTIPNNLLPMARLLLHACQTRMAQCCMIYVCTYVFKHSLKPTLCALTNGTWIEPALPVVLAHLSRHQMWNS